MKKSTLKYHLKIAVTLIFLCVASAMNGAGLIPVMNYQRADYNSGAQNWDVTQDAVGNVYVANYNGMLAFDGQRWKKYYLSNFSTVRCLLFDNDAERIYAGGSDEFGYFTQQEGKADLSYVSLTEMLPANSRRFAEVWNILRIADNILFCCDKCIFCLKDGKIEKLSIPGRISCSTLIGRKIFIGMEDGRILSLKDGNLGTLKEEGNINGLKIVALLYGDDSSLLACTPLDGLFELKNGFATPFTTDYSQYLKEHQIFCGSFERDKYVFGTVTGGAIVVNRNTGEINLINKDSGMKNNTVLKSKFDRKGNLWLCLDNGLTYASLDSRCRHLIGESDFIGAGYASVKVDDYLLLGTNQGLYKHKVLDSNPLVRCHPEPVLHGQVWSITQAGDYHFISTDSGLFLFDGKSYSKVDGVPGVFKTLCLTGNPSTAIASTYDSFYLLDSAQGKWKSLGKISGGNDLKGDFIIDDLNRVWLAHWQNGIYMLTFNPEEGKFISCSLYDSNSGLPANDNNTFAIFEDSPVSSTYNGIFDLDAGTIRSVRNKELSDLLRPGRRGHLKELYDGSLALINEEGLMITRRRQDGEFETLEVSGPGLYHEIIPGFTDIGRFSNDELIVSTQSGFSLVNIKGTSSGSNPLPFVSNIYADGDSLIFRSPMVADNRQSLKVSPEFNNLRFEFAYPECDFGENIEFSSYLENHEKDWTPFSTQSLREYSNLSDGNYVLHLKVRNNYSGEVLESSFGFTVTPPWFRTSWAKGLYAAISFVVLLLIFASVRTRMTSMRIKIEKRKEKELHDLRKEKEREAMKKDMEIAGLKTEQLEQEIKYKSDELSATTMSLISKNEALREIGTQISRIQKLAAEAPLSVIQKNLSKLQASIEENISKDPDWKTFNKNFDLVYGDYMKRLLKLHPDLSQSEKRLCCYIRMGLSSKEIAPLINISFRSVEMARYRLRKKMSLAPEAVLSEYLARI